MKIRSHVLLKALFASKGNLRAGAKPRPRVFDGVAIAPFKNDARAAACISADFELSWAFRHHSQGVAREQGRRERDNIPALLKIFERHPLGLYTRPLTLVQFLSRSYRFGYYDYCLARAHPGIWVRDQPSYPDCDLVNPLEFAQYQSIRKVTN